MGMPSYAFENMNPSNPWVSVEEELEFLYRLYGINNNESEPQNTKSK